MAIKRGDADDENPKKILTGLDPPDYEQAIKDHFDNPEYPLVFQGNKSFDKLVENVKLTLSDEDDSLLDSNPLEKTNLSTTVQNEKAEVLIPAWCNLHDKDMWWNDVYDPTWIKYKTRRKKIFALRIILLVMSFLLLASSLGVFIIKSGHFFDCFGCVADECNKNCTDCTEDCPKTGGTRFKFQDDETEEIRIIFDVNQDLAYLDADEPNEEQINHLGFQIPDEFQPNPDHIQSVSVEGVRKIKNDDDNTHTQIYITIMFNGSSSLIDAFIKKAADDMDMNAQKAGTGYFLTCGCYKECAADCENKTTDFDIVFLVVPAVVLIALIAIIFYLKRGQGSFCVNNTYSCCNIQRGDYQNSGLPAVTYNCENFYGHYDNRKNINVMEPRRSKRRPDTEYRVTMKRLVLGINVETFDGKVPDRKGTWKSTQEFQKLSEEKLGFSSVSFRRNATEAEVRADFQCLKEQLCEETDMVMIFVSSHAPGPNYQGCIVLSDEPEFDIQRELLSLRNCMDKISGASGLPKIPLVVFSQCCYGSDAIPNRLSNTITSFATVSGEVAVRNFGTMMVPYVEILNRALNKYGSNCDLYEILLYVQRFIENEKIPIGPAGQYMKGSHQQTLTKKLYFFRDHAEQTQQLQRMRSVYRNVSVPGVYPGVC